MGRFAYTLNTSLDRAPEQRRERTLVLDETLVIRERGPAYRRILKLADRGAGDFELVSTEHHHLAQANGLEKHFILGEN